MERITAEGLINMADYLFFRKKIDGVTVKVIFWKGFHRKELVCMQIKVRCEIWFKLSTQAVMSVSSNKSEELLPSEKIVLNPFCGAFKFSVHDCIFSCKAFELKSCWLEANFVWRIFWRNIYLYSLKSKQF